MQAPVFWRNVEVDTVSCATSFLEPGLLSVWFVERLPKALEAARSCASVGASPFDEQLQL